MVDYTMGYIVTSRYGGEVVNGGRCTSSSHSVIELRDSNEVLDIEKQLKHLEKNIP